MDFFLNSSVHDTRGTVIGVGVASYFSLCHDRSHFDSPCVHSSCSCRELIRKTLQSYISSARLVSAMEKSADTTPRHQQPLINLYICNMYSLSVRQTGGQFLGQQQHGDVNSRFIIIIANSLPLRHSCRLLYLSLPPPPSGGEPTNSILGTEGEVLANFQGHLRFLGTFQRGLSGFGSGVY